MESNPQTAPEKTLLERFDEARRSGDWETARALMERAARIQKEAEILVMAAGPTEFMDNGLMKECLQDLWQALYKK